MGAEIFDYPKDIEVLARLFSSMTNGDDLILDFFAGSGSTGHAVWLQNQRDGGKRRFILVQCPERPNAKSKSGAEAIAQGYETIFALCAERLKRAAVQYATENVGLKLFCCTATNLEGVESFQRASDDLTGESYLQQSLEFAANAPVKAGTSDLNVAWEVALKSGGVRLSAAVERASFGEASSYVFFDSSEVGSARIFVLLCPISLDDCEKIDIGASDMLIVRGDLIDDSVGLTLAARFKSRLVLLERVPREVSL